MSIKVRLISAFALSLLALIGVVVVLQQSNTQLLEARKTIEHSQILLERLETIVGYCKDIETGQRGFGLTRQEVFLEPYERALGKLNSATAQMRTLVGDSPAQQKRLDRIEELEAQLVQFTQRAIEITRTEGTSAAAELTGTRKGKDTMDQIRSVVNDMEADERAALQHRSAEADHLNSLTAVITAGGAALAFLITISAAATVLQAFNRSMSGLQSGLDEIQRGNFGHTIVLSGNDEFTKVAGTFNAMAKTLKQLREETSAQSWLNDGLVKLGTLLQGQRDLHSAAQQLLSEFASSTGSRHGMLYAPVSGNEGQELALLASYAHHERKNLSNRFALGQGLVGQCALERQKILLSNVPDDYATIGSGTGEAAPRNVLVFPVLFENELKAVIEQASFEPFTPTQLLYFDQAAFNLGVILNNIETAQRTQKLLSAEQSLTEELQRQQTELAETNVKLESLASSLQVSEEELRQQQEELQQTNEELEERSRMQSRQNAELEAKNLELEQLREAMQEKAQQLSQSSKYKSQFLSNMSHELRTPLNSLLILSKVLMENGEGNLTEKQVDYATTINAAGVDLLALIDDVLDISKIEAGVMSIDAAEEPLRDLCTSLLGTFEVLVKDRNLELILDQHPQLPRCMKTDGRRLQQILKNLIANAIKFTREGSVSLRVEPVKQGWHRDNHILEQAGNVIAFSVVDTGIGIAADKQAIIFEAFRQADGSISRKFGGTGLGLAISREIARLLGGEIHLQSEYGKGSTFTLYLPVEYSGSVEKATSTVSDTLTEPPVATEPSVAHESISQSDIADDRANIQSGDKVLLLVARETELSKQLSELARSKGFKIISAAQGKTAFALVQRYKPDAIVLDVSLPEKDGWIFFDRLKRDSNTRHVPIHILSDEERSQQARRLGAIGYSSKPASKEGLSQLINQLNSFVGRKQRNLLIVEDDANERQRLKTLIEGIDVNTTAVSSGHEAVNALKKDKFDCMILDLGLPDISGFELLNSIRNDSSLGDMRVIVHTSRDLTAEEENSLRRHTEAIVIKGAKSPERLLDETMLFLHRVETNLPEHKRRMLERLHLKDPLLTGRKVLIVDDDMRHIFAITSLLEQYDMTVTYAENGRQAVGLVGAKPELDIILMDVMMPDMDGYETMRALRKMEHCKAVPIIALTAKAMKGDKEECIAAGASDYLSKPVDSDQLLSLMRVWLY